MPSDDRNRDFSVWCYENRTWTRVRRGLTEAQAASFVGSVWNLRARPSHVSAPVGKPGEVPA